MIVTTASTNELYLVSRGKAEILNAGEEWYVQARDIVGIKAGDAHDILEVCGGEDFEFFRLYEPGLDGARLGAPAPQPGENAVASGPAKPVPPEFPG